MILCSLTAFFFWINCKNIYLSRSFTIPALSRILDDFSKEILSIFYLLSAFRWSSLARYWIHPNECIFWKWEIILYLSSGWRYFWQKSGAGGARAEGDGEPLEALTVSASARPTAKLATVLQFMIMSMNCEYFILYTLYCECLFCQTKSAYIGNNILSSEHQTGHSIPNDNKNCESFLSKYFNRVPDLHFETDICIDQNIDLKLYQYAIEIQNFDAI